MYICVASAIAVVIGDAAVYLWLIEQQDSGGPVVWFLTGLGVALALGAYGVAPAPWPGVALGIGGLTLITLGMLGLASIGAPLILAGLLYGLAAAVRQQSGRRRDGTPQR